MCGSFVPAEYASFRWAFQCKSNVWKLIRIHSIHDALLSRLSNDDDMEKGLSTFANEMTSSAMILGKYIRFLRIHPYPRSRSSDAQNACPDGWVGPWHFALRRRWDRTCHRRRTYQDQGERVVENRVRWPVAAFSALYYLQRPFGFFQIFNVILAIASSHFRELSTTLSRQPSVVKWRFHSHTSVGNISDIFQSASFCPGQWLSFPRTRLRIRFP